MEILEERYVFDNSDTHFVHVLLIRRVASGVDMGGPMWLERKNVSWVVEKLRACITTYAFEPVSIQAGQDSLSVSESGPEQQPVINLRNRRPAGAPHPGPFTLSMSKPLVARFADELENL